MIIIIFEEQYSRPCNSVTRATIQSELVWVKAKEKSFCVHQILWPCSKCSRFAQRVHFWLFTVTHEMAMFEEQYHTNQSELGHVVLRFWECYMRAFSPTRFCVIALSIRCVAVQWRAKWVHTVKTEAKHRISARQGTLKYSTLPKTSLTWKPCSQAFAYFTICVHNQSGRWEKWWQSRGSLTHSISPF